MSFYTRTVLFSDLVSSFQPYSFYSLSYCLSLSILLYLFNSNNIDNVAFVIVVLCTCNSFFSMHVMECYAWSVCVYIQFNTSFWKGTNWNWKCQPVQNKIKLALTISYSYKYLVIHPYMSRRSRHVPTLSGDKQVNVCWDQVRDNKRVRGRCCTTTALTCGWRECWGWGSLRGEK